MTSGNKSAKRRYSDDDKGCALAALDANKGNVRRTAHQLNVPAATLRKWRDGFVHPEVTQKCAVKKRRLADKLEDLAHKIIDAADGKIEKAGLKDSLIAFGTAVDKMQLLRGKPTAIVADTARATVEKIMRETGLPEADARTIVAAAFQISETELVSEEVM